MLAPPSVDFKKFGATETQGLSRIKKLPGKNLHRNWVSIPLGKQGVKLTPLIFVMKAVVAALKAFPHFNTSLDAQGENLILKKYFHIGVAVDTQEGLNIIKIFYSKLKLLKSRPKKMAYGLLLKVKERQTNQNGLIKFFALWDADLMVI